MWEIGDRVVVTKAPGRTIVAKLGYKGTVIDVVDTSVLVEFDKYIGGHSGNGVLVMESSDIVIGYISLTMQTQLGLM